MPARNGSELYGKPSAVAPWSPVVDVDIVPAGFDRYVQVREVLLYRNGSWRLIWDDNYPPGAVTGLALELGDVVGDTWTVNARWQAPADVDVASYRVTWTVNDQQMAPVSVAATATAASRQALGGDRVHVAVEVIDGLGQVSQVATADRGLPPGRITFTGTRVGVGTLRLNYSVPRGAVAVTAFRNGAEEQGIGDAFLDLGLTGLYDDRVGAGVGIHYYELYARNVYGEGPHTVGVVSRTLPAVGPTIGVTAWTYSSVDLTWSSRTDTVQGMPGTFELWDNGVHIRDVRVLNADLPGTARVGVGPDTYHRFQVRVRGDDGFYSPLGPELRVRIGRDAWVEQTPWSGTYSFTNLAEGQAAFVTLPSDTTGSSMRVEVGATLYPSGPYIDLQNITAQDGDPNGRQIWWVLDGQVNNPVGAGKPNPWVEEFNWFSGSGAQGIYLGGAGWADNAQAPGPQLSGNITVRGTRHIFHPATPNGYW